jgi:hypothetical protein
MVSSQDLVMVGGGARIPVGPGVLQPDGEARLFRRADGVHQGYDLGIGVAYEIPGDGWVFLPSARAHLGHLELREGIETGFKGIEIGLAARFGGAGR